MSISRLLCIALLLHSFFDMTCLPAQEAISQIVHPALTYAEIQGQKLKLDLYLPENVQSPPLLVWIHGGGWRGGSRKAPKLGEMVQHGFAVASISYRLTDKELFPA